MVLHLLYESAVPNKRLRLTGLRLRNRPCLSCADRAVARSLSAIR